MDDRQLKIVLVILLGPNIEKMAYIAPENFNRMLYEKNLMTLDMEIAIMLNANYTAFIERINNEKNDEWFSSETFEKIAHRCVKILDNVDKSAYPLDRIQKMIKAKFESM